MRSCVSRLGLFALAAGIAAGASLPFHLAGEKGGPWQKLLGSVGFESGGESLSNVVIVPPGSSLSSARWDALVEGGAFLILEGESEVAAKFGFQPGSRRVRVQNVQDLRAPKLPIIWEKAAEVPLFTVPKEARVFARERWEGAPLLAGYRKGSGAVLWLAVSPGAEGYERFPYILQALNDLGLEAPFRSSRLWAFFDYSYRTRVDLDYFASRWREAGVSALQVAAWHFYDPDSERDEYLGRLIRACHRRGILVYAWFELPHVSEKFWQDHPEWRERTGLRQDAQLDWRKLMNLANRDCFRAAAQGTRGLIERFDWDGVNLAELYFESLEGYLNPARFTPMNDDVRREFRSLHGFDPLDLYDRSSPVFHEKTADGMRTFLEYRAALAKRMQEEWIGEMESVRRAKPALDLVLTHVDDRFDTRMRDLVGADAARVLPLLDKHDFTFLIEDPATIWNLGPARYPEIARRYEPLTPRTDKLAIDINVVERYQDVYPTKQQTGAELFQLVHLASSAFQRVALYFENSILPADLRLLPASAASVMRVEQSGSRLIIESPEGVGLAWKGPAVVNGSLWPVYDGRTVWLPRGTSTVEASTREAPIRILDFNGDLKTASALPGGVELAYRSASRAFAVLDKRPVRVEIDGESVALQMASDAAPYTLSLPRGQHLVTVTAE